MATRASSGPCRSREGGPCFEARGLAGSRGHFPCPKPLEAANIWRWQGERRHQVVRLDSPPQHTGPPEPTSNGEFYRDAGGFGHLVRRCFRSARLEALSHGLSEIGTLEPSSARHSAWHGSEGTMLTASVKPDNLIPSSNWACNGIPTNPKDWGAYQ